MEINENVSQRKRGHGIKQNERRVLLGLVKMVYSEVGPVIISIPLLKSNRENRTNKQKLPMLPQ